MRLVGYLLSHIQRACGIIVKHDCIPVKVIASPLTCTSLMDPTKDGDGAALPFVLLSILSPGGTPPMYQLS